jgi:predicted ATP-dependent serine protease
MSRFSIALGKILPPSPILPKSLGPRTIVVGKPGSGKTTLLINDAIKDLNTGVTKVLYCNYSTSKESVNIVFEKLNKKYIDNIFFISWPDFHLLILPFILMM